MAAKYVTAAFGSGLKGGPLGLLLLLCHKAGTGKPFKSGKVIPEGEILALTDKTIMKALAVNRRQTIREWRQYLIDLKLIDSCIVPYHRHTPFEVHSAFVGLVILADVRPHTREDARLLKKRRAGHGWFPHNLSWVLKKPRRILPVKAKGQLSLFDVPKNVERRIVRLLNQKYRGK